MSHLENEFYTTSERPSVPALDKILGKKFPLLDHGFVRVVDYMGDDSAIVQAARVSYGKGTKAINEDKGLINYLMRHKHTTPFEMCDIKFHIKAPIFVARQWLRHRTASVNEYSARYSVMNEEFYMPPAEQMAKQSTINKQGREDLLPTFQADIALNMLKKDATRCYDNYQYMIGEYCGLTRELARMNLTLNYYTEWYWKINLHNLLHFLRLRADPHAQHEIRVYAECILNIIKEWVPFTYTAFEDYSLNSFTLSGKMLKVVREMIVSGRKDKEEHLENSGLTKREFGELMEKLNLGDK